MIEHLKKVLEAVKLTLTAVLFISILVMAVGSLILILQYALDSILAVPVIAVIAVIFAVSVYTVYNDN